MAAEESKGMLVRGLTILEYVAKARPGTATAGAISEGIGLPKSTVYRLTSAERSMGFLSYDEQTKAFSLGLKFFELAAEHSAARTLAQTARPIMEDLSGEIGETVQLSVLNGSSALFVGRVSSRHAITIRGGIGESEPLYATSTGKVLLAGQPGRTRDEIIEGLSLSLWTPNTISTKAELEEELSRVAQQGYAVADEEFDAGVVALGAPIFDYANNLVAAMCISAPKFRMSLDELLGHLPKLREATRRIGLMLVG